MEPQEIASLCRMSSAMMGDGRIGPGLAQVNMDTMFVRDGDFFYDLAVEMAGELGDVYSHYHELRRGNEASNDEEATKRRMRSEAVKIASELVDVMRHIERGWPERWQTFQMMIRKQTLNKIVRKRKDRAASVLRSDVEWCARAIERHLGVEKLDRLLTIRADLA